MHEFMQVFNLLGSLAPGVDLLGGLAADKGARERNAVAQPRGAGMDVQLGEGLGSLPGFVTLGCGRVEDRVDRLAGGLHELERGGDGLNVEDGSPAGHEDEVRGPGGLEGVLSECGAVSRTRTWQPASRARRISCCSRLAWAEMTTGSSASRRSAQLAAEACGSRSMIAVLRPLLAKATARCRATVVLPAPPFWLMSATVCMAVALGWYMHCRLACKHAWLHKLLHKGRHGCKGREMPIWRCWYLEPG